MQLKTLTVRGYKSIRELDSFEFRSLNVLIGANGAGKSNLISLFRLLAALAQGNLQNYVQIRAGGPDALLFGGRRRTQELSVSLTFGINRYRATLEPTSDNRLVFTEEQVAFHNPAYPDPFWESLGTSHQETRMPAKEGISRHVLDAFRTWRVYHFHDTSDTATVKQLHASNDNLRLKEDAANLAAYLAHLRNVESRAAYDRIVDTIRLAAPFFDDFVIRDPLPSSVQLEWTQKGEPDTPYRAHVLSDGTLRFICLTTLLLQPRHLLPDTVLIDEPELGLHPYAIGLLAEMLKQVATDKQVIVSTQSAELLSYFGPEDVVVVDREGGASTFHRLQPEDLTDWLENYTMDELWKRNILGGTPSFSEARL